MKTGGPQACNPPPLRALDKLALFIVHQVQSSSCTSLEYDGATLLPLLSVDTRTPTKTGLACARNRYTISKYNQVNKLTGLPRARVWTMWMQLHGTLHVFDVVIHT